MPTISTAGAEVFYEFFPGSPGHSTVTLINGYARPGRDLRSFARTLHQHGYGTLLLDNRGIGQTVVSRSFVFDDFVDDIVSIWKKLELTANHLLGVSMGGVIARHVALRESDQVASVAMVSSPLTLRQPDPFPKDLVEAQKLLSRYLAPSFAARNAALVKSLAENLIAASSGVQQQQEALASYRAPNAPEPPLTTPALIIHGEADQVIPVSDAMSVATWFEAPEVRIFSDIGHLLLAECPKRLYASYLEFLDGLSR